jgi:hypothetical protein
MYAASFLLTGAVLLLMGFLGTFRIKELSHASLDKGNVTLVHLMSLVVALGLLFLQLLGTAVSLSDVSAQPPDNGRDQAHRLFMVLTSVSGVALTTVLFISVASSARLCVRKQ